MNFTEPEDFSVPFAALQSKHHFLTPYRSEIEFLHAIETCPLWVNEVSRALGESYEWVEAKIDLWRSLGRPHPVSMRNSIKFGDLVETAEIKEFLRLSWAVYLSADYFNARSGLEKRGIEIRMAWETGKE